MIDDQKIKRINELYKKLKTVGLNENEKIEQELLRKEYVTAVRASLRGTLDCVKVVDENGNDVTPQRVM